MSSFASNVDYNKLYATNYFGHQNNVTSFPEILPSALVGFCQTKGLSALFDVSGGNGELSHRVSDLGIDSLFSDVSIDKDGIQLDLSEFNHQNIKNVSKRVNESFCEKSYLVTCFDVLEHMDIEDIPASLQNLCELVQTFLIVSISTRPSSAYNRFHTSIFPWIMWKELLNEFGFDVLNANIFPECSIARQSDDFKIDNTYIIDHWQKMDIFKDIRDGEPRYILLKKRILPMFIDQNRVSRLLDLEFISKKRQSFNINPKLPICFAVNSAQDVHVFTPLLQAIPRHNVYIALRRHVMPKNYEILLQAKWERCGIVVYPYEKIEDLDLSWMRGGTWISATESTMWIVHQLGFHAANHAKMSGLNTILLQHGIWMESSPGRSIAFASKYVATWGDREQTDFKLHSSTFIGRSVSRGTYDGVTALQIGSPKFADASVDIDEGYAYLRFGIDRDRFSKIVLIGLNLQWYAHRCSSDSIIESIRNGIISNPDTFFIIKIHTFSLQNVDWPKMNTITIDDYVLACLDITMSRLVKSVNIVLSTLSTLLLDAAIAGIPCLQLDTDAEFSYDNLVPTQVKDAFHQLNLDFDPIWAQKFIDSYAKAARGNFYSDFARLLEGPFSARAVEYPDKNQIVTHAMGSEIERQWLGSIYK